MVIVRYFMLILALGITTPLLVGCGGGAKSVTSEGDEPEVGEFAPPRQKAMESQQQQQQGGTTR